MIPCTRLFLLSKSQSRRSCSSICTWRKQNTSISLNVQWNDLSCDRSTSSLTRWFMIQKERHQHEAILFDRRETEKAAGPRTHLVVKIQDQNRGGEIQESRNTMMDPAVRLVKEFSGNRWPERGGEGRRRGRGYDDGCFLASDGSSRGVPTNSSPWPIGLHIHITSYACLMIGKLSGARASRKWLG